MHASPPRRIGTTELWSGRLYLDRPWSVTDLQQRVTQYVVASRITVVGYYMEDMEDLEDLPSLTLLRWPETREEYQAPSIPECDQALVELARALGATAYGTDVMQANTLHTMMGRKIGGYQEGEIAPVERLKRDSTSPYSVHEAHMISTRALGRIGIEEYGEPVGIIVTSPEHESAIHQVADEIEQHHYPIARCDITSRTSRTELWETRWANS